MEEEQKKTGGGGFLKARLAAKQALKAGYNTGFEFNPTTITGSVTESFSKITLSDTSSKASVSQSWHFPATIFALFRPLDRKIPPATPKKKVFFNNFGKFSITKFILNKN